MAYVNGKVISRLIGPVEVYQYGRAACGAKEMIFGLGSTFIGLKMVEALGPDDILTLRVYKKVSVLGANGTVATVDLFGFGVVEGGVMYSIADGATVTICVVPDSLFLFRHG